MICTCSETPLHAQRNHIIDKDDGYSHERYPETRTSLYLLISMQIPVEYLSLAMIFNLDF